MLIACRKKGLPLVWRQMNRIRADASRSNVLDKRGAVGRSVGHPEFGSVFGIGGGVAHASTVKAAKNSRDSSDSKQGP